MIIIGLEGGIWLGLAFTAAFGTETLARLLAFFDGWQIPIAVALLALTYVVGIIIDRFADSRFRHWEFLLDEEIVGDMPVSISVMRFSLGTQNDFLNQQLEYTRMRMRIVRASTVNSVLIALSLSALLLFSLPGLDLNQRLGYTALTLAAGAFFSYACFRAWKSLIRGHLRLAKEMYDHQTKQEKKRVTKKS